MPDDNKPDDRDAFLSAAAELIAISILQDVIEKMIKALNGEKQDPPRKRVICLGPVPEAVEVVEGELDFGDIKH